MTARDLIKKTLKLIGVIGVGETPTAEDSNDSLDALNDLLSQWTSERLSLPVDSTVEVSLSPGGTYTVTDEIVSVNGAFFRQNSIDTPLRVITKTEYNLISTKSTVGTPDRVYYEPGATGGTFYFYPVPNITATAYIRVTSLIGEVSGLTTNLSMLFSRQYLSALKWGLALELCAVFDRQIPQIVLEMAGGSKKKLEREAFARKFESVDIATGLGKGGGGFNIYVT